MKALGCVVLVAAVWLAAIAPTRAGTITTPAIVAETSAAAISCMRWMPIGLCFWLRCSWTGCRVRTSLKVGHYNPDLVVSAYNALGDNPWLEIRAALGLAQQAAARGLLGTLLPVPVDSAGNRTEGTATRRDHRNLLFRESDAIGHPLGSLSGIAAGAGLLCQSQTAPFLPYFQSSLDPLAWRFAVPEILYPASVVPGMREIGSWPLNTWGGLYPRTGWTTQADEPKAAAVIAQRAGDIVTRGGQPHVYVALSGASYMHNDVMRLIERWVDDGERRVRVWVPSFSGQKVWPPGPLVEKDHRTGTWQMLAPVPARRCDVFGVNDLATVGGWGGGKVDSGGDYVWNLWRPYRCCKRAGQLFLFDVSWLAYPP